MSQELHVLGAFTPYGLSAVPTPSGDPLGQDPEARYFLFESEASEHRLDTTALGYSTRDELYQSKIGLGADGVFAAVNAEEEIFVHRNTVVWSSGGCVRKSFTVSHPITQAMLVNFHMAESRMEDSTDKPAYASDLCVLHSEGLSIFCADGKTFSVATPYEMERMWPLPSGLLLQRAPNLLHHSVAPVVSSSNNAQGDATVDQESDDDDVPTLFSLLHPLEEIRPVSYFDHRSTLASSFVPAPQASSRTPKRHTPKTPGTTEHKLETQLNGALENEGVEDATLARFVCAPHLRLVYSSADVPLVVLYNTISKLHSIWLLRKQPKASPADSLDSLVPAPATTSEDPQLAFDSLHASFQAGYARDLSWEQERSSPLPMRSDLKLDHVYTETPRPFNGHSSELTVVSADGSAYEGSSQATQIFLIVTPDANLRLCFMLSDQKVLHLYTLASPEDEDVRMAHTAASAKSYVSSPNDSDAELALQSTLHVTRKKTMSCLAAIPLRVMDPFVLKIAGKAIRLSPSYLLLGIDHRITLYSMNEKICECILPPPLQPAAQTVDLLAQTPRNSNGTPLVHRTPSSSHLVHAKNLQAHSASAKANTPKFVFRTPAGIPQRLVQSSLVFSPMTPGSPFPLPESDLDVSISALDLDMSIHEILLQASPATPLRPSNSAHMRSLLGTSAFETPAKLVHGKPPTRGEKLETPGTVVPHLFSAQKIPPTPKGQVVEILQPVSNRFSILFDDGRIFRVSLKIAPSSPLILDCLRASTTKLPYQAWHVLLSEYLAWKHELKSVGLSEWDSFALFLQSLLPLTSAIAASEMASKHVKPSADALAGVVDDDDWNFLLDSDFHAAKMREAAYQIIPVSKSLGHTEPPSQKSTVSKLSGQTSTGASPISTVSFTERLKRMCAHEKIPSVLAHLASWSKRDATIALQPFLSLLLHSLHLLCENYKLSILTLPFLSMLSDLLLEMSVFLGWNEYANFYASASGRSVPCVPQQPEKATSGTIQVEPQLVHPPSIMDWIQRCLRGFSETFPIFHQTNQPCELTRKLCRIYYILVHGLGIVGEEEDTIQTYFEPFATLPISLGSRLQKTPRTSPIKSAQLKANQQLRWNVRARLAVVAMDEEFSDPKDLDVLPFGIALPLREAIHHVRHHPPTNWPLSCYRFIGREDLAMQGLSFQKVSKSKYSLQDPFMSSSSVTSTTTTTANSASTAAASGTGISSILNAPYHHPAPVNDPSVAASIEQQQALLEAQMLSGEVLPPDGTEISAASTLMRFCKDERLSEVSRLLRSSRLTQLVATEEILHQDDRTQIQSYKHQLAAKLMRLFALPVGRGMFALSAELDHWGNSELHLNNRRHPEADVSAHDELAETKTAPTSVLKACARAEPMYVPPIILKGRRPDSKTLVTIEGVGSSLDWGEFHNGVAAGLRIPPSEVEPVSWQWIASNRPKSGLNAQHAGFLLAMGLQGHFKHAPRTGLYDYLSLVHPLTSSAILVGYAACTYGTRSSRLTKVLDIHLPRPIVTSSSTSVGSSGISGSAYGVLPTGDEEVKVSEVVQSAAMIAVGLGFAETNHRHHVESLLSLLSHPPVSGTATAESFCLSSGIALGFVCLGQGHSAVGLADLDLVNRLLACVEGTKERSKASISSGAAQASETLTTAHAAGGLMKLLSHHPSFSVNALAAGFGTNAPGGAKPIVSEALPIQVGTFDLGLPSRKIRTSIHPSEKVETPVAVKRSAGVNKEASAPGATLALGLIYLKTNDALVASRIALPSSAQALSYVRPDVQTQRVIAKNLIMWNAIKPTTEWLHSQFPPGCLQAGQILLGPASMRNPTLERQDSFILQRVAFATVTAGACMSLGLRFAGSLLTSAVSLISASLNQLVKLQKVIQDKSDRRTIEWCISQVFLSWSLIMAGSGDLDLLRVLRKMRKKLGDGKTADGIYGQQMAISMAVGFLFVGGGRYSVSTSNKAIAALLASLYPIWPQVPSDERYHLQLLRHLYVLAVEPRCLEARDVDHLTPEFVPVRFWVQGDDSDLVTSPGALGTHGATGIKSLKRDLQVLDLVTPCLMPPRDRIVKIEIRSPLHWRAAFRPIENTLHKNMFLSQKFVLVKKRHGLLQNSLSMTVNGSGDGINETDKKAKNMKQNEQNNSQTSWNASFSTPILTASHLSLVQSVEEDETLSSLPSHSSSHFEIARRSFARHPTLLSYASYLLKKPSLTLGGNAFAWYLGDEDQLEAQLDDVNAQQQDQSLDLQTLSLLKSCADEDKEPILQTLLWLNKYVNSNSRAQYTNMDRVNIDLLLLFYDSGITDDHMPSNSGNLEGEEYEALSQATHSAASFLSSFSQKSSLSASTSNSSHKSNAAYHPIIPSLVGKSMIQSVRSARYQDVSRLR